MNVMTVAKIKTYSIILYATLPELVALRTQYGENMIEVRKEGERLLGLVSSGFYFATELRDRYTVRSAQLRHDDWWSKFEQDQGERQYRGRPRLDVMDMLEGRLANVFLEPAYHQIS